MLHVVNYLGFLIIEIHNMKKDILNIKGVRAIYNKDMYIFQYIEKKLKNLVKLYGYNEIKLPILEKTSLFHKSLGKNSDILTKEMYSFIDKDNNNLTLLPEGTASCTKYLHDFDKLRNNQKHKIWYLSPMFRRENPQKFRKRLFYQFGIESFGYKYHDIEIEHIIIISKFFKSLRINDINLEINCIGNLYNMQIYNNKLFEFLTKNKLIENISHINPIKILDKLNIIDNNIPAPISYLTSNTRLNFIKLLYYLKKLNINFVFNKYLVRGLDYYNDVVYEWTTKIDTKKISLCSGGRYDNLSENINKKSAYATGFAFGIDRIISKICQCKIKKKIDGIILFDNKKSLLLNYIISETIRTFVPNINLLNLYSDKNLEQQIKKIKKLGIEKIIRIIDKSFNKNIIILNNKEILIDNIKEYI
jgi:histidyl-tRNA synthetase